MQVTHRSNEQCGVSNDKKLVSADQLIAWIVVGSAVRECCKRDDLVLDKLLLLMPQSDAE